MLIFFFFEIVFKADGRNIQECRVQLFLYLHRWVLHLLCNTIFSANVLSYNLGETVIVA